VRSEIEFVYNNALPYLIIPCGSARTDGVEDSRVESSITG